MFIAGIRKLDRTRGEGWLDCPNCHEHAAQDVVDEMRFATLGFYRFLPIARRRMLVCRRCAHRRRATAEEMRALETAGRRVGHAWLVPIGLTPFIAVLVIVALVSGRTTAADNGLTYQTLNLQPIASITMDAPTSYNRAANPSVSGTGFYSISDPSTHLLIRVRRYPVNEPATQLFADHYDADASLNDNDFPSKPPKTSEATVGDAKGVKGTFKYKHFGDVAEITFYAVIHNGVGYTFTFLALSQPIIDSYQDIVKHMIGSVSFRGNNETPGPKPTPSPGSASSSSSSTTSSSKSTSSSSSSTSS